MRRLVLTLIVAIFATHSAVAQEISKVGEFVAGDVGHGGGGQAAIVLHEGGAVLEITQLQTDPGPDLRMILVEAENAITSPSIKESNYIILGDLQATTGDQTYQIPEGTDTAKYNTAAIWCEEFGVLFIAAPLATP